MNADDAFDLSSLDEDDKRSFLRFIKNTFEINEQKSDRESVLAAMVELVEREPGVKLINVIEHFDIPFVYFCDLNSEGLYPAQVLLISYGKPETELEVTLTLKLLKMLDSGDLWSRFSGTLADFGLDWIPRDGWGLPGLALVCQCHPLLTEYLVEKVITRGVQDDQILLAAVLVGNPEIAKRIVVFDRSAFSQRLHLRSRHEEIQDLEYECVFTVLLSKPELDWSMQLLKFILKENYESGSPQAILFVVEHEFRQTASRRKAAMLLKYLVDQRQNGFTMRATNWSVDGLCFLMSGLEGNTFMHYLHFAFPERLLADEPVRAGFSRMVRSMSNLRTIHLVPSFEKEWRDDNSNNRIVGAFADALPNDHIEIVSFYRSDHGDEQPLYFCPAMQRIVNNVAKVFFFGSPIPGDELVMLLRSAAQSSVLEKVHFDCCEFLWPESWPDFRADQEGVPSLQELSARLVVRNLEEDSSLDCLGEAFHHSNVTIDTLRFRGFPSSGLSSLIARSTKVDPLWWRADFGEVVHIGSIWQGIQASRNLQELNLNLSLDTVDKEETRRLFESVTSAISHGKLVYLTCPFSLVRHRTRSLDGWERLHSLEVICEVKIDETNDFHSDPETISGSELERLGKDMIRLMEKSSSLSCITTDFALHERQASILRHMLVCKSSGLSEVFDVNAGIETVIKVASRVWETKKYFEELSDTSTITAEVDKHDAARLSAAFDVVRESAGIIADWCKSTHWRWQKDKAGTMLVGEDDSFRDTKRRRCHQ